MARSEGKVEDGYSLLLPDKTKHDNTVLKRLDLGQALPPFSPCAAVVHIVDSNVARRDSPLVNGPAPPPDAMNAQSQ